MPNLSYSAMPRGSWQRPTTRLLAALNAHASPIAASFAPGSARAVRLATGADEDEDEAESSNGRGCSPMVGGWPMT